MITYKKWWQVISSILILSLYTVNAYSFQVKDTTVAPLQFIRSWVPVIPIKDAAAITRKSRWPNEVVQLTSYYDGLGRPVQTVKKRFSPGGTDQVTISNYDSLGREAKKYLPYVGVTDDGDYKSNWLGEQYYTNGAAYPGQFPYFSETTFEKSPLERVVRQMKPGAAWGGAGRGVSSQYSFNNLSDSVRIWELNAAGTPVTTAIYDPGELDKNVITNENGQQTVSYTNREGLVILTKTQASLTPGKAHMGWNCTYYVYDDFSRLCALITPLAVSKIISTWNVAPVMRLCNITRYDGRGRVIMSKTSDVDSTEMVYDSRSRLVFSRDGSQRQRKEWSVNFYDEYNRLVMAAIYPSDSTRAQLQALMNTAATSSSTFTYTIPGIADLSIANYKPADQAYKASNSITFLPGFESAVNAEFTASIDTVFTTSTETVVVNSPLPGIKNYKPVLYNYYDDYSYAGVKPFDQSYLSKLVTGNDPYAEPVVASNLTNTLLTGQKVRVFGTEQWLTSSTYYDEKGRPIQARIDNITGGESVATFQYNYSGKVLSSYHYYENRQSGVTPVSKILTVYTYDTIGNVISIKKKLNDDALLERTILVNSYNRDGLLSSKKLGKQPNGSFLETISYDFNVQGWLTGMNTDYLAGNNTDVKHFGMQLGYESGFNTPQYTGNASGVKWKGWNDKINRQYNFSYDQTNQLTGASFTQQNTGSTSWTNDKVNYTVDNLSYDANGNIRTLKQSGLIGTQPGIVDDLVYNSIDNSNQLKNVYDKANNIASKLGDFKEPAANNTANISSGLADYTYDVNGNLLSDANKGISKIAYNSLDLPEKISVLGKGTIQYVYDALGAKLRKIVVDSTVNPVRTIKTDYVEGLVYLNDSLQFIPHREGRIRTVYTAASPVKYVYDYFIKDQLDNTRMVLTEQTDFTMYAATMETAAAAKETVLFSNVDNTRASKPVGYPVDQSVDQNNFVSRLNAAGNQKVGPSIVLRVMAGDTINIGVKAFYKSIIAPKKTEGPVQLEEMIASLIQSFGGNATGGGDIHNIEDVNNSPFNANFYNHEYQRLKERDTDPAPSGKPRAYLNYALFDDQFSMVDNNSGVKQVKEEADELQTLASDQMVMQKSGFLYVYTTNESQQDVYFDNLVITKGNGPVLEEMHYYPGGLLMDGISYKAYAAVGNNVLFQGKERQYNEFNDGTGLEWYDFEARYYDPQLGRWFSPDPAGQDYSPYMAMGNRYITVKDPDGRFWHIVIGALIGGTINVITHSSKIHSWQDGLVAFGIGAAAGALGAATGGAAAAAFELSTTTFMGGVVSGAVGGGYGKLAEGTGNSIYFGDQFKMSDVLTATVQGAALGGALGTIGGRMSGKTGMDLIGQPKINGKTISLSLSSGGKTIDPMYSSQPRLAGAGGLGEGGSYTMPEYAEGNFYKPATTYNRDGKIVFATASEGTGGELGNIKVNINLNPELATATGGGTKLINQFSNSTIEDAVAYAMKNKVTHVFAKAAHNLDPLVTQLGGQENTFRAVLNAANGKLPASGVFNNVSVNVGGYNVIVRGSVVNGVPKIGTMFIP